MADFLAHIGIPSGVFSLSAISLPRAAARRDYRRTALTSLMCATTVVLVGWTWPLWTQQDLFPQVPLVRWMLAFPPWLDTWVACALMVSLTSAGVLTWSQFERLTRGLLLLAVVCLLYLCLANQHRLQPWAYQFALYAWWLALAKKSQSFGLLRGFVVSMYLYSALNKFDYTFTHTTGALMVETGSEMIGWDLAGPWPTRIAWGLPGFELLVAILLMVPSTRRIGVASAIGMHLGLVILLGPLGLNHNMPVLLWNVGCLLQVLLLFVDSAPQQLNRDNATAIVATGWKQWVHFLGFGSWSSIVAALPILLAIVLPLLEPLGRWDPWLSWGLYSKRFAKLDVWVARPAVPSLPPIAQRYCDSDSAQGVWVDCAIDRWSLDTLRVPLYPHARFYEGVARALAATVPSDDMIMSVRRSIPDRWTGDARTTRAQPGQRNGSSEGFFWNSRPRPFVEINRSTS